MPSPSPSPTSLRGRARQVQHASRASSDEDVESTRELMRQTLQQARLHLDADDELGDVDEPHTAENDVTENEVLGEIHAAEGEGTVDEGQYTVENL